MLRAMPIDPKRLARVRKHFLAAAALAVVGCGGEPAHTNEPVHTNQPMNDPNATPTADPTADPSAAPTAAPAVPPGNG